MSKRTYLMTVFFLASFLFAWGKLSQEKKAQRFVASSTGLSFIRETAPWTGRLILPALNERRKKDGCFIILENVPEEYAHLRGQKIWLSYKGSARESWAEKLKVDVVFGEAAAKGEATNAVHPKRLNGRKGVGPLESLAGALPEDKMIVSLAEPRVILSDSRIELSIAKEPIQISGQHQAFIKFLGVDTKSKNHYRVVHYNPVSKRFDGPQEVFKIDQGDLSDDFYNRSGNLLGVENHELNERGWSVFGEWNHSGEFVAKAMEPYSLFHVDEEKLVKYMGRKQARDFLYRSHWDVSEQDKGRVRLSYTSTKESFQPIKEGDQMLVMHLFGANDKIDTTMGIVTGHFSWGFSEVRKHPFTGEAYIDLTYKQVYAHNSKGIISGTQKWHHYMGNMKKGWMWHRAVSESMVPMDLLLKDYKFGNKAFSPKDVLERELDRMMALYRTGDGTGASIVTSATNCSQDSNQAMMNTIYQFEKFVKEDKGVKEFIENNPQHESVERFRQLQKMAKEYKYEVGAADIVPFIDGVDHHTYVPRGIRSQDAPGRFTSLRRNIFGLMHWKTVIPRRAHDEMVELMLKLKVPVYTLQSFMIGGDMPGAKPVAPTSLFRNVKMRQVKRAGLCLALLGVIGGSGYYIYDQVKNNKEKSPD